MFQAPNRTHPNPACEHAKRSLAVVAEDDDVFRALLCDILRGCGYSVREVKTGAELLEALVHPPWALDGDSALELVVTDECIPDYQSIEVVLQLHTARRQIPHIAIAVRGVRRAQSVRQLASGVSIEDNSFELEGFRKLAMDVMDERSNPVSLRVTLRPSRAPTLKPAPHLSIPSPPPSVRRNRLVRIYRRLSSLVPPRAVGSLAPSRF